MLEISLTGNWRMRNSKEKKWEKARVPGSVLNDLLENNLIEDPYFGDNELQTLEILKNDFVYEKEFYITGDFLPLLSMDQVIMECKGIDTIAYLFINKEIVASVNNMHRTYTWNIENFLHSGKNMIQVYFYSAALYAMNKHDENPIYQSPDTLCGFEQVRKAHFMYGWDWGPKLPDMGIWQDISIKGWNNARLAEVYIKQKHFKNQVELNIDLQVQYFSNEEHHCRILLRNPDGQLIIEKNQEIIDEASLCLTIDEPDLWWPNGYGKQPLYEIEFMLEDSEGKNLDRKNYRIGLRTLTIRQEKDRWGESFEFAANGIAIFAMGANYIPEDSILPRCTKERSRTLIESCVRAHFNCLRIWGGATFAPDYFYELCDEYGIILWQDLLFACAPYDLTDEFEESIRKETVDNIKRLRHHASLGLWCGNNELEWGWCDWDMGFGSDPKRKADYIKQFEYILPGITQKHDPCTFYWPSSPSSGGSFDRPNDQNLGDVHYWEVWHRLKPFSEYRKYYFRFCSEFGFQSFPSIKTVESFTLPEDRNVFSYVMENHQKNRDANGRILSYLAKTFLYPQDFATLLYTSQIVQAEAIKYGVEHWRRHRGRCMGAIYWQLNDCWPVASWSSIDYFGRWKALHYFARRFFAPLMISAEEGEKTARLAVANETQHDFYGTIVWSLRKNTGEILAGSSVTVQIQRLSSSYCVDLDFSQNLQTKEDIFTTYLEYRLLQDHHELSEGSILFTKPKYFKFLYPNINLFVADKGSFFEISITTKRYAKYIELTAKSFDFIASDNYFDLSKGQTKYILIDKKDCKGDLDKGDLDTQKFENNLLIKSAYNIGNSNK